MASLEQLLALQGLGGGGSSGLDTTALLSGLGNGNAQSNAGLGLDSFSKTIAANDPFSIASGAVDAWKPNTSTWSPTETGITSFAKAFIGGALGGIGRNNQADQLNSVIGILPQLYKDPASVATPDGVDQGAFDTLKGNAILKNYLTETTAKNSIVEKLAALGVTINPDGSANTDVLEAKKGAGLAAALKTIPSAGIDKIATGATLVSQFDKLIDMTKALTPNPHIPILDDFTGGAAGDIAGGLLRGAKTINNSTAEAAYNQRLTLVQEMAGKILSGSARWPIVKANLDKVAAGTIGTPQGIADLLKQSRDIAFMEAQDHADKYGEAGYNLLNQQFHQNDPALLAAIPAPSDTSSTDTTAPSFKLPDVTTFIATAKAKGLSKDQARQVWEQMGGK